MKSPIICLLVATSAMAVAQDIPAPLNVTTLTAGRQEILTLQNQNAGVVTGGGDEADLLFEAKTDAGNVYRIGGVGGVVTNRANATRTGDLIFRCGPGEGMSERLRIANDGSVVVNGSGAGALRVGTASTDNRTNTQVQVLGSMAAYASSDSSEADVFASDPNFYNNGSSPTWAGANVRWYGKTAPGNWGTTSIPLAKMALFLGQNANTTALAANGNGPIYILNSNGMGVRVNSNLSTSFFGNPTTAVGSGEVQIGGGQINTSGNVTVGSSTANANLAVIGTITSKEIKVTSTGADYVFADGYALRPLAEVEAFVTRERHLPGMMAAKEMAESGLPVSQVVTVQLAKIEELTLYAIAAERERQRLEERATALDKRNAALEASLASLSARLERLEAAAPRP